MATTAAQKLAALCMPAAAFGLALVTADPSWNPPRKNWGSLQAKMEAEAAAKIAAKTPPPPDAATVPAPAGTGGDKGAPAPAPAPAPGPDVAKGARPSPAPAPAPAPAKPAMPDPSEVEFKVSGLALHRGSGTLKTPAADRLDVHVAVSGALRVNTDFADPSSAAARIGGAEDRLKTSGLLYIVPNARAPWDPVKDLLNEGAKAGFAKIAVATAIASSPGQGRVLLLTVPASAAPDILKGIDPQTVKVRPGVSPSFELNGEECKDAAALEAKAKALHEECELMAEGYAADVEKSPWTVDGTGAMAGNVVVALDALAAAGIKAARLAGVHGPGEAKAPPAPENPPAPEKPAEEKPAPEKPAEDKPAEEKPVEKPPEEPPK